MKVEDAGKGREGINSPIAKFLDDATLAAILHGHRRADRRPDVLRRRPRTSPRQRLHGRAAPEARQGPGPGRRRLGAAVGHRLPDVRMGRRGEALRRAAPPVHRAGGRRRSPTCAPTRRPRCRAATTWCSTATRSAAVRSASTTRRCRRAVFELLGIGAEEAEGKFGFLLDALQVRRAAARRHRLRHRPHRRADGRHRVDPRRDRLPEDHDRAVPDDRRAVAGAGQAAGRSARVGAAQADKGTPTGRVAPA